MNPDEDATAEVARLKDRMLKRVFYVMRRRIVAPEKLSAAMLDHYRWIIALEKQGMVFASGPVSDSDGKPGVGMTVFRAEGFEEAARLAAGDPFCLCGAAEFDIVSWQVNEGRISLSADFSDQSLTLI